MAGGTAICFVLANPRGRPIESLERDIGSSSDDTSSDRSHWSPQRRMGYRAGLQACLQSLRRRHGKLPPVLVLSPEEQRLPAEIDAFIRFDPTPYAWIPFTGSYFGPEIYYKLEVFNLRGYDRILYLDCDTLVLDDISSLWDPTAYTEKDIYAVRETAEMGVHPAVVGKLNTGVMLINRPLLCDGVHRRLLDIARTGESYDGGDQGVLNGYLDQEPRVGAGQLDAGYNVMVVVKKRGQWDDFKDRIKILHFTNRSKPWAADHDRDPLFDREFKRLWDEAYAPGTTPFQHEIPRTPAGS